MSLYLGDKNMSVYVGDVLVSGGSGYDGPYFLWAKGPAPDGFHVPSIDEWIALSGILTSTFGLASNKTTFGTYLKMPDAGFRTTSGSESFSGSSGSYWSSTPTAAGTAHYITLYKSSISTTYSSQRGTGANVRCFKNSPVIPSGWTTLYQGSGSAGIFWNQSDGLISVSGNGTTWYTIQDKNLGATSVFSSGTPTDANSGYYYQWGNNYGFPHSGSITTSSTQASVDQTTGTPYSSSTFITGSNGRWNSSSTENDIRGPKAGEYVIIDGTNYYKSAN